MLTRDIEFDWLNDVGGLRMQDPLAYAREVLFQVARLPGQVLEPRRKVDGVLTRARTNFQYS